MARYRLIGYSGATGACGTGVVEAAILEEALADTKRNYPFVEVFTWTTLPPWAKIVDTEEELWKAFLGDAMHGRIVTPEFNRAYNLVKTHCEDNGVKCNLISIEMGYRGPMLPAQAAARPVGPRKPPPALPAEVWNDRAIDPDEAMRLVRLLCGD